MNKKRKRKMTVYSGNKSSWLRYCHSKQLLESSNALIIDAYMHNTILPTAFNWIANFFLLRPSVREANLFSAESKKMSPEQIKQVVSVLRQSKPVAPWCLQGSHRHWKTWNTWKTKTTFSSQGKVREFWKNLKKSGKSQGILNESGKSQGKLCFIN